MKSIIYTPYCGTSIEADRADIKAKQKELNAEIKKLPTIVTDETSLIQWIERVLPLMDRVGVTYDNDQIISILFKAGYKANYGVGKDSSWFTTRARLAGWLIGQFMTCKYPGLVGFCDRYTRMKK